MLNASRSVNSDQVQAHYDELDIIYQRLWGRHLHHGLWVRGDEGRDLATEQLIEKVISAGGLSKDSRICDIGCGYGETAKYLAEKLNAIVCGVTLSEKQVECAKKLMPDRGHLEFLRENWLDNSLRTESFDHAIALESSEHATDKSTFFKQAHRVLRPGGSLTICAWVQNENASNLHKKMLLVPICDEGRLPSLYTSSEYVDVIKNVGFKIRSVENLSAQVAKTWSLVLREMSKYTVSHPQEFWSAYQSAQRSQDFLWTPLRMWGGFKTGALQYVLISAIKAS